MTIPKNLGEVMREDLSGYKLKKGYFLRLKHGLMGTFPAIITEGEKFFVCINKDLLKQVWGLLPKRNATVTELLLYVNLEKNLCFSSGAGDNAEPIHILSEKEFETLSGIKGSFIWASGLFDLTRGEVIDSPFI
ncbi:MAG: hypothetical protein KAJ58_01705 [Candidatus Pacebacteria bacterium]|nr:hypothetical protein [Candidatus Paceibacterota bacterium]